MVKIYNTDGNESDVLDAIVDHSQPVYVYSYSNGDDYTLVSDKEIDEDDLEDVAENLIDELDEDEEDDYDDQS